MGFAHVVLAIKDGRRNTMCGKFGFGDGVQALVRAFDFPLDGQPDVFLVALQNNADILISDIDDRKIASRIPAWYRKQVQARTFVLFPIAVKGKPVGLIYADCPQPGDISIPEKELSLLKSLRNQAVLAIRQSV
jgi:GAF domain-containing protein